MNGFSAWFEDPSHFIVLFVAVAVVLFALRAWSVAKHVKSAVSNRQSILGFLGSMVRMPGDRSLLRAQGWDYRSRATIQWPGRFSLPVLASTSLTAINFASADIDGARHTAFTAVGGTGGTGGVASIEMIDTPVVLPTLTIEPHFTDSGHGIWLDSVAFVSESIAFNKRWSVQSVDTRFASAVLSPLVIARLMGDDLADVAIGIDGAAIVNLFPGPIPDDRVLSHFALLRELLRLIPQGIVNDFGTARPDADGGSWQKPTRPRPPTPGPRSG